MRDTEDKTAATAANRPKGEEIMTAEEYMGYPFMLRQKVSCLKRVQQTLREQGEKERAQAIEPFIEKTEKERTVWHKRVVRRIALLPDENERRALTLRFLEGLSPIAVAECMAYCERQVYRFVRQGVMHMEGMLGD